MNKYEITEDGVFLEGKKIADYINVIGEYETEDNRWRTRIEFKNLFDEKKSIDIGNGDLYCSLFYSSKKLRNQLARNGFSPFGPDKQLKEFLRQAWKEAQEKKLRIKNDS